ncbi:MAG: DKNYY domain-containing protein [Dysgonomonas sp.]|nr:DKNYY domain-containing protein [Dysgonomonas sp.]
MIKYLVPLFLICLMSACFSPTDTQVDEKSEYYYYSLGKRKIVYKHLMTAGGGFFPIPVGTRRIELDADPKTFEVMDFFVGRDAKNVYVGGKKLEIADAASFEIMDKYLYKDKSHVYLTTKIVDYADAASFGALPDNTFRDKNHMYRHYLRDSLIIWDKVDVKTYEVMENTSFAKDKDGYLYLHGRIDVDTETFCVYKNSMGYDKNNFYNFNNKTNAPIDSYPLYGQLKQITEYAFVDDKQIILYTYNKYNRVEIHPLEDRNSVFVYDSINHILEFDDKLFWDNNIQDIKPDKASFVGISDRYGKDKNHVYWYGHIIEDSNPAKFEVIDEYNSLSKDDKYVFHCKNKIEGANPETISFEKREYGSDILNDKNRIWIYDGKVGCWVEEKEKSS